MEDSGLESLCPSYLRPAEMSLSPGLPGQGYLVRGISDRTVVASILQTPDILQLVEV